ncbi:hypothetical protein, partial [Streptomyces sp. WZ.A104]|uniref:hypothetical protein n=1 Tax=Streptomyces sp. WZ.A104 TaxID=2023771 RepID=UPI00211B8A39
MTSELFRADGLDGLGAVVAALPARPDTLVYAPQGAFNTGTVHGDQRMSMSAPADSGPAAGPMRQGPVRAKRLAAVRRRFAAPPGFDEARAALDSGIVVLIGEPGTGRETHALNLLAHGREEPVVVQVDGAVNLSRWTPRPRGVHGYLVMEPPDPFELRAWDLSRLEALLAEAEAGARLVIVVADAPGLGGTLEDRMGVPVLRHLPPDPGKVFAAHLADGCPEQEASAVWLRTLEPGQFAQLLPDGLPPRSAAQTAEAVIRLGVVGGSSGTEVVRALARAEGREIVARAQAEPPLLAHLVSVSVYGGLHWGVVAERAAELLSVTGTAGRQDPAQWGSGQKPADPPPRRPWPDILRALGAHRAPGTGQADTGTDTVSFFRPAVTETVWEVLCREHAYLLPKLHTWLAATGHEADQIERAGRAAASMAAATLGRSLEYLRDLALAPYPAAPEVAARCLGAAVRDPAAARTASDLLEQWSTETEAALRKAVAHACHADRGGLATGHALDLIHRLMDTPTGGPDDDTAVFTTVETALVQLFATGDSRARATVLGRMREWKERGGVPGLLAALAFPGMASADITWWSERIPGDAEVASGAVELTGHALNESITYGAMRDALLVWCCGADGPEHRGRRAPEELFDGLVAARQPGFLRWLLSVERGPDTLPGKGLASLALTEWRSKSPALKADQPRGSTTQIHQAVRPRSSTTRIDHADSPGGTMPLPPHPGLFSTVERHCADSDPTPRLRLFDGSEPAGIPLTLG